MFQSVYKVMIVRNIYVSKIHRCPCIIEINLYAVIRYAYRPEQSACSDSRVEVVDLIRKSNLPLIKIQSDETECAMMLFPIQPNVHTLYESHIHIEEEGTVGTGIRVCSSPSALDLSGCNCAVEIGNRRFFDARSNWKYVEQLSSGTKGLDASRDGSRGVTPRLRQPRHP